MGWSGVGVGEGVGGWWWWWWGVRGLGGWGEDEGGICNLHKNFHLAGVGVGGRGGETHHISPAKLKGYFVLYI